MGTQRNITKVVALQCFCLISVILPAQQPDSVLQWAVETHQMLPETDETEEAEEIDPGSLTDTYNNQTSYMINLGVVDPIALLQLQSLSREEAEAIYRYQLDYGPLVTIYELAWIQGFSPEKMKELLPHVFLHPVEQTLRQWLRSLPVPRAEVMITGRRVLEERAGYLKGSSTDSTGPYYIGDPWQERVMLRIQSGKQLSAAIAFRKDPGEAGPDATHMIRFDDLTAYLSLQSAGAIKKVIIGNYGISLGQGLTIGSGGSGGFGVEKGQLFRPRGMFPSLRFARESVFRGMAATVKLGNLEVTAFFSHQPRDAVLIDTLPGQNPHISSLPAGGYHRTLREVENRNKVKETDVGMYLSGGKERWKSGFSLLFHTFNTPFATVDQPYRFFLNPSRQSLLAGWDFMVNLSGVRFTQELSWQLGGSPAWTAGIFINPAQRVTAGVTWTWLSAHWQNPHVNTMRVSSSGMYERSLCLSFSLLAGSITEVKGSMQHTSYPWLRYRTSSPSEKHNYHLGVRVQPNRNTSFTGFVTGGEDLQNAGREEMTDTIQSHLRYTGGCLIQTRVGDYLTYKAGVRGLLNITPSMGKKSGFLLTQDLGVWIIKGRLKWSTHLAFFETVSWDERLYAWEPDVFQGFSIPAHYGKGVATANVLYWGLNNYIDVWLKFSRFTYPGLLVISSGQDEIVGNRKSEVKAQLRWKISMKHRKIYLNSR